MGAMTPTHRHKGAFRSVLFLALVVAVGWGCAIPIRSQVSYAYFTDSDPDDPWSRKIRNWQERERADRPSQESTRLAAVAGSGDAGAGVGEDAGNLRNKYDAFRAQRKRALARELAEWIQTEARDHYVDDGPIDHWATLEETFRTNGDDCDGLELLVYNFLQDLGFDEDEVFRAIVYRRSDGQHHMVTLWFEDRDDPWVIDPTGAMTTGMPRMSGVPGWVPLKIFGSDRDFTVRGQRVAATSR